MNWLNKLIRSEPDGAPRGAARAASVPRAATPVDIAALRLALAQSSGPQARSQAIAALGAGLAASRTPLLPDDGTDLRVATARVAGDRQYAMRLLEAELDETALGEIALQGRNADLRLAAARRIAGDVVLERVMRESRHRDNNVYQHCSDLLRHRRQAGELERALGLLATELRQLLAAVPLSVSALIDIERRFRDLGAGAQEAGECEALVAQATARARQDAEAQAALISLAGAADALLRECADPALPEESIAAGWRLQLADLTDRAATIPAWLTKLPAHATLGERLRSIDERLRRIDDERAIAVQCEPIDVAPQATVPEPVAPVPHREPAPKIELGKLRAEIEALERAIEEGRLGDADEAARPLLALPPDAHVPGEFAARLRRAIARLGDMRGWASWGADRKREEFITMAQALASGGHPVAHLASAVPELREQWKQLCAQDPSSKAEWEAFDTALTQAFQPVLLEREREAVERERHRAAKEALCAGWEAEWAAATSEGAALADLVAFEARRAQILLQWRAAPAGGFRDERRLRKRFDALIAAIDERYEALRAGERARREELIRAAQALGDGADFRAVVEEVKALQLQWKDGTSPVRLSRGDEQGTWKRFRTACDALFEQRDANRAEEQAQRKRQVAQAQERLDAFEALLGSAATADVKAALNRFRQDWDAAKRNFPGIPDACDRRARDLQSKAQTRIDSLRVERYRERLQEFASKQAPLEGLSPQTLQQGLETRQALLIDMEIALGLPTPPEFDAARRLRKIEMLRGRFQTRDAPTDAEQTLAQWFQVPAAPDEGLDRRLAVVVAAMTGKVARSGQR